MSQLTNVIGDGGGGVFATSLTKEVTRRSFIQSGAVFLELDGVKIRTATQFLAALGEQLLVPDLAEAEDWDYLHECLVYLDEFPTAESVVVFFDQFQHLARAEPAKWATILEVFAHAVEQSRGRQKPMYIFLRGEGLPKDFPMIDQT
jgi:hypothetical protein